MTTKAVEKVEESAVPALAHQVAMELDAEDISLPKLKIGQATTPQVKSKLVEDGDLFTCLNKEDDDPVVLASGKDASVRLHIVGLKTGRSDNSSGELVLYAANDPDAPPTSWKTYTYLCVLPEVDEDLPYSWLLTKSGKQVAQQINTIMKKAASAGQNPSHIAFELSVKDRQNPKGSWKAPSIRQIEAKKEHLPIVDRIAVMASGLSAEVQATQEEPEI